MAKPDSVSGARRAARVELAALREALAKARQEIREMADNLLEIQSIHDKQKAILYLKCADLRTELNEASAKLAALAAQEPVGTGYTGSATRDGFQVVWRDGFEFPDGPSL